MKATWLTWRIHRFEVLFALALAALLGVSAWVIADQIRGLGLGDVVCWPRTEDGDYATRECATIMERYWGVEGQGALVRVGMTVVPVLIGLILGVTVVARELELRTAGFAWALTPRRMRWLVARLLPMLLVALIAIGFLAWSSTTLFDAMWLARRGPDLTEIAGQGLALVTRGLAGFAVALLVGALIGRTMPALLIGVVVLAGWGMVIVPRAQGILANERAVWTRQDDGGWRDGNDSIAYADYDTYTFDPSQPGLPGEPGLRVDQNAAWEEAARQVTDACGESPEDVDDPDYDYGSPEYQAWSECADPFYLAVQQRAVEWSRNVPRSAWPDFATLDIAMSAALGGVALLLSFVVVSRRRPE
jgi:hypothetical protein